MAANSKPVIWITRKLSDKTMARAGATYDVIANHQDRLFSGNEIIELSERVDAILPCHSEIFNSDVVTRLSDRVQIIANHSVGVDHCDLDACKARGIVVTNTPDVLSDATAEIAILLMLGAARRAPEGDQLVRSGQWRDWSPSFMVGQQITGKRFGVLGMGRVGRVAAARARGFGMEIHYHNRRPVDGMDDAIYHATPEALLESCDVLSIHCPATEHTIGLVNAERLALLPEHAIVINTARGGIVDDEALVAALRSRRIWAAGLDVFNDEPEIHPGYRELNRGFMLPHIGSATFETRDAMGSRALDNLDAFFAGQQPADRVA